MSRAFVTDKEDWVYCAKAGERCMHAEEGKACSETGCEFFEKESKPVRQAAAAVKVVKKKAKDAKAAKAAEPGSQRTTKKSKLRKPKKWGGRSGFWTMI